MDTMTHIDEMIEKAHLAQVAIESYTQEQIDAVVKAMGKVVYEHAEELSVMAVEETHLGRVDSKILKHRKNIAATWTYLKDKKSVGIIEYDEMNALMTIAKPVGVVACLAPTTNPTSTVVSNGMSALKCRNAMIVSPHPRSKKSTIHVVRMIENELRAMGAPENLIQVIETPSLAATQELMSKSDVVLATGGSAMIKSAYSSGRPCYGVGPGNVQVVIAEDFEDYDDVAKNIIGSRGYDNGITCTGEQAVHVQKEKLSELEEAFVNCGAVMIPDDKLSALKDIIYMDNGALNPNSVGLSPKDIADKLGIQADDAPLLFFKSEGIGEEFALCREKLCPVVQLFGYEDYENGVQNAKAVLEIEGKGHSAVIYTFDEEKAVYAGETIPVSRVIVNQPGGAASGNNMINGLNPTMSLGCGSWGNNSISENLTYRHLMNTTRLAYRVESRMPSEDHLWDD